MTDKKRFNEWASEAGREAEIEDTVAMRELSKLRSQLREERRLRRLAEKEITVADRRAAMALDLAAHGQTKLPPIVPKGRKLKSKNRGLPVLMCSDWHVEEVVDPKTVNNRNAFDPKIAERRIGYLSGGSAWLVNQWSKGWKIDECVVWFGGDMITGYIHEELIESNAMSPTEATLFAQEMMARHVEHLLAECKLKKIHIYCSYGNHGRTTKQRRVQTGAQNSFEWMAYHSLAQRFAGESRVEFHIADGAHLYADLYGTSVRFHHGDDVRYQGGVGGLSIPLRKACDSWDKFQEADVTVIGHWHQFVDFMFAVVNGSLIGYNAYALSVKARWEPPRQGAFLIDEEWGKRLVTPIYCDPDRKVA